MRVCSSSRLLQGTNTADTATDSHELYLHVSPSIFSSRPSSTSSSTSSFPAPRCYRTAVRLPGTAVATVSLHSTACHCIQLHSGILTRPQNDQGRAMPPPAYGMTSLAALSTQTPFCQLDLDWDAHFALPCNPHNTTPLPFSTRDSRRAPEGARPNWDPVPGVIKQPSCFCLCNDRQPLGTNNIASSSPVPSKYPWLHLPVPTPAPAAQRLAASSRHRLEPPGRLADAIRSRRGPSRALPSRGSHPNIADCAVSGASTLPIDFPRPASSSQSHALFLKTR